MCFGSEGKKGEIKIIQKSREKIFNFSWGQVFFLFVCFFKYGVNRIYVNREKEVSGEKETCYLKEKRYFGRQDCLCTVLWHLGIKNIR